MNIVDRFKSFTTSLSVAARTDAILTSTLCVGLVGLLVVVVMLVRGGLTARDDAHDVMTNSGSSVRRFAFAVLISASTAVLATLYWFSYATYIDASVAPADTYDIQVLSEQGNLSFIYPSGKVAKDSLVVPVGKPVRLVLSSKDVPRGISLPSLRLQQLAIPGRFSTLWFSLPQPARFSLRCTEGCAKSKAKEPILQSLTDAQFDAWLSSDGKPIALNAGAK